jgi:hypothetical protein
MRLDMIQGHVSRVQESLERADLVEDRGVHVFGRDLDAAASEAEEILEAWVGADFHVVGFGEADGLEHEGGVAGVETAGDVGGVDVFYEVFVGTLVVLVRLDVCFWFFRINCKWSHGIVVRDAAHVLRRE